jgi:hypothetical protein
MVTLNLPVATIKVPSRGQLAKYSATRKAKDGPKLDDLRLDLASGGLASLWNKRASQIFAERFISEPGSCCTDINLVKDAFMAHLKQLQTRYRAQVRDERDESEPEFEKLERMQERKEKAREARRRAVSATCAYIRANRLTRYATLSASPSAAGGNG